MKSFFEVAPVGKAGKRIDQSHFSKFFNHMPGGGVRSVFPEYGNCAPAFATGVQQRSRADLDGNPVSLLVPEKHLTFAWLCVVNGFMERAVLAAQAAARFIDVDQYVIRTLPADNLGVGIPGNFPRTLIPIGDFPIFINKINAVEQVVYKLFAQFDSTVHNPALVPLRFLIL
jgi:hypothetical protein